MSGAVSDMVYALSIAAALTGQTFTLLSQHVPAATTADFYEVRSVRAVRNGDSATLIVDRTVKREVPMSYAVRVFQVDDRGAHLVCTADHGPYLYRPDALLPSPVTLEWWTGGDCREIPPGHVEIETTWNPRLPGLPPVAITTRVEE
jgi:hypothetical protein